MAKAEKVLMLVENLSVPADPRVWREARTLAQQGLQVCIISPLGATQDRERYICLNGIHIYRYRLSVSSGGSKGYLLEYAFAMLMTFLLSLQVWFQHGFDVIHAANPPDLFFAIGLFYRLFGKKFIFDQHDLAPEMFQIKFQGRMRMISACLRFFEWCSYRTSHLVITTNASQKQMAIKRGGCKFENVFIVRNGPELHRYQDVVADHSLRNGKRILLAYVGVMAAQDGVEYAIHAMEELVHRRKHQDVGLILMGDGDQVPALRALTHSLALDDYIHFTGWLVKDEMLRYLAGSDIGLSPDPSNELNDYSTMLKTMEYMALGKPVIAFDLPETRITAQDAALYATANRLDEFVDHIEILMAKQELRATMGEKGQQRIEEHLCWEKNRQTLLRAYRCLFPANQQLRLALEEASQATLLQAEELIVQSLVQ